MLGQPKFQREDRVSFTMKSEDGSLQTIDGVVYVVDAFGTFEQNEEPSYDIEAFFEGRVVLFKHIRETLVNKREV